MLKGLGIPTKHLPLYTQYLRIGKFVEVGLQKNLRWSQPAFTSSKLTIETVEKGVKYVQR